MKSKMESASEIFSRAVGSSQALLSALGLVLENIMDDYEQIKHDAASDESVSLRSSSAKPDAARSREG